MKPKRFMLSMWMVLSLTVVFVINMQAIGTLLYLDWRQVVPSGSGDPNMFGEAIINVNAGRGELCYDMRVFIYPSTSWPPTGAGIYKAPFGSNGPLVVDLDPDFSSSSVSGCLGIEVRLARDIQRNPRQYYLLVTDSEHPEGASRVQLK